MRTVREQVQLRLVARAIDLHLWLWCIILVVWAVVKGELFHREWQLAVAPWAFIALGLTMPLDAAVQALFGTTPGRFWAGVAVRTSEGRPLLFRQHLSRNCALWVTALACFLPPFYVITFPRFYKRLLAGTPAPYDKRHGYQVIISGGRRVKLALWLLILQSLITIAGVLAVFLNLIVP